MICIKVNVFASKMVNTKEKLFILIQGNERNHIIQTTYTENLEQLSKGHQYYSYN